MLKENLLYRMMVVVGVLIIILGLIHISYTPILYKDIASIPLDPDNLNTYLYMFVATGASLLLAGVLVVYSVKGLKRNNHLAWVVSLTVGIYILLLGIGAVVTMHGGNPFAYIMLVLAVLEMFTLLLIKRSIAGLADRKEKL